MNKLILYLILILVTVGCNANKSELNLNGIKSFKKNLKYFVPDKFEQENIPYPKIDSQLFISYFSSIPELKEYSDHPQSVFVYSKNKFPNGIKGITLMAQDDIFTKKYILVLFNRKNKIQNSYLIAYSTIDEEWYDVTETKIIKDNLLKTNKVSCKILSQVDSVNYCKCDSSNVWMKLKPNGELIKTKEKQFQYQRIYN